MIKGEREAKRRGSSRAGKYNIPRLALWAGAGVFVFAAAYADEYVYWYQWGSEGNGKGQFDTPWGVAVAPYGRIYVTDTGYVAAY